MTNQEIRTFSIIGMGRAGTALYHTLTSAGYECVHIVSSKAEQFLDFAGNVSPEIPDEIRHADIWFICVPDDHIEQIGVTLAANSFSKTGVIFTHISGARGSELLGPLGSEGGHIASFHPMQTITATSGADSFKGVIFTLEGSNEACEALEVVVSKIGGKSQVLSAEQKLRFHLAGVVVSNFMSSLVLSAAKILSNDMAEPETYVRTQFGNIMRMTLHNILENGFPDAITGPAFRGDRDTLVHHLAALEKHPQLKNIYLELSTILAEYPLECGDDLKEKRTAAAHFLQRNK
jgi:predicted short-subunit dehydrogenase-like oxidoreductase (DUF2520 family)